MNVEFAPQAWQDFVHWQEADPKVVQKIIELIEQVRRTPFTGLGKPEPLKGPLKGYWSRRITSEHRLVYGVVGTGDAQKVRVLQCRWHYE
ncbi:MAG: Txe/YoeB family addiction module toxin [Azospirillaceae bacterium]|nr:Txe/YoeB family addiction module toxin [Azospirillaceae bacterium]